VSAVSGRCFASPGDHEAQRLFRASSFETLAGKLSELTQSGQ